MFFSRLLGAYHPLKADSVWVVTVKRAVLDSADPRFRHPEKALRSDSPVLLKSECGSARRELTASS